MKSLFKTVALITVFSFLTRICGFLFRIILSYTVGGEGVGLYQVAFSVFMVLLTIISSGIPLIVSRMSAKFSVQNERKKEASLVATSLIFTLAISILLCLVVILFKNVFAKLFTDTRCIEVLIVLLPSLVFSSAYIVCRGALWGRGNYFALCITELYEQLVRIVLGVLFISSSLPAIENAFNLGWTMSLACLFSMTLVIVLFFYYGGKFARPNKEQFFTLVKDSSPVTLMRTLGSFIQPLIGIIVPFRLMAIGYTKSQAMNLFGVAIGMTLPLLYVPVSIIGSLSTALLPDISKAMTENNQKHIEERITNSIFFSLLISSVFIPVYLGMGELAGEFLYGNTLSGTLLASSVWVLLPIGITNITSGLLNSLGLEHKSFVNFLIGGVCLFICLWFFPAIMGANSLIFALGVNYLVTAVLNLWLLKRKTKLQFKIMPSVLKILLLCVPSSALTSFVVSLCEYVFPAFITLVVGGIVAVGSFILLAGAFGMINLKSTLMFVKNKIKLPKKKKVTSGA